jgi:hypothetical protein
MTAVFIGMIGCAGAGVAVAAALARYAQRNWTRRPAGPAVETLEA